MKNYIIPITFLLIFIIPHVYAQENETTGLDALKTAYINIKHEKYAEAYVYFQKMLKRYPKDPTYNYYTGICLLYLENNPSEALKHLRFASVKDVPEDVWFYLGLAYLKNYQFNDALENFERFRKVAGKKQLKEIDIDNFIFMAHNGLYLTTYIKEPIVYSKKKINTANLFKSYTINNSEGKFVDINKYLTTKKDSLLNQPFVFMHTGQDIIYYADKNKKRGDYDIYKITKVNDTLWSTPENLGEVINTPFDENYPYIHSDGLTLYFASKGHYSMGGYDLYKSTWDWNTQQWTEPENLDFPINSPYNDFLFIPSPDKRYAQFSSDRNSARNECFIYKIKQTNSQPYIKPGNHEAVLNYASLNINSALENVANEMEESPKKEIVEIVKVKTDSGFLHKNEYDSLINLAVNYQLKADSLKWAIDDKRQAFDKTKEGKNRVVLGNIIIELEREVYQLQKKSDNCYKRVREIEQSNMASKKGEYENIRYKENNQSNERKEKVIKNQKLFVEPVIDSLEKFKLKKQIIEADSTEKKGNKNEFEIKLPPVYNTNNPIPLNEKLPKGVIYMIQLGAFSTEKAPSVFNGLTPLYCIKKANSNIRKYYAGRFFSLKGAEGALPDVKKLSFSDAYIVAFYNNEQTSLKEAVKLEVSNNKPDENIPSFDNEANEHENLSIIYVLKSQGLPNDTSFINNIRNIIPDSLEIFIEKNNGGENLLIKSFTSFEKADKTKTKIEAVAKSRFEIHAYFAENHIPLGQARKIAK